MGCDKKQLGGHDMKKVKAALGAVLALATTLVTAQAQTYPDHPVTLVVPFAPGGSTTIIARTIADKLGEELGQQVVVDNRAGAGGTIGTKAVAKSTPDGYTLLLGYTGTLAVGPTFYPNAGYDPRKDFAPIGCIGTAPNTIAVHPSFPVKSIAELIAYAKANPGKVNFGSAGIGTLSHIAGEHLATMAGITLTHIPYKGTGPAMTDLLGGHIPMAFAPIPAVHGAATGGQLRVIAVTAPKRSPLLPDVPTVAESGLPGYEAVLRYGLVAPAGTPRPIVERLNKALNVALANEEVRKRLALDGAEPQPGTPESYAADIDREETQWAKVVKAIGVTEK
jgi:tripartite-type tricarboxylate transporter receptor subunit TctC